STRKYSGRVTKARVATFPSPCGPLAGRDREGVSNRLGWRGLIRVAGGGGNARLASRVPWARGRLLERNQVPAAERRRIRLQKLVGPGGIALIQDLLEADGVLLVGGGGGRIHRNHDGIAAHRRADRRVGHRAADLPADDDDGRDAPRLQRLVEIRVVEPVLSRVHDLDVARSRSDLRQPL